MNSMLREIKRRVFNVVTRAIVLAVDDEKKIQELNALVDVGVKRSEVERFQNYGFTSVPMPGAQAVVVNVGGKGDHPLAIAVDDRRYRVKELEGGEVAVYDKTGTTIVLKKNGEIQVSPSSGRVVVNGDLEVDGEVHVTGDVNSDATISGVDMNVSGVVTADGDVVAAGVSLKTHTHSATLSVSTTGTASAQTGTATGNTDDPI